MCVMSMIGDHYTEKWIHFQPVFIPPSPVPALPAQWPASITRVEFDALRADVEEMKKLLLRAKAYDEANGEPNCEMEGKVALLRQIAKFVGVDLESVFPRVQGQ